MVLRDERLGDEQRQAYAKRLIEDDPRRKAARLRLRLLIGTGAVLVALAGIGLWVLGVTLDASLERLDERVQAQRQREVAESGEEGDEPARDVPSPAASASAPMATPSSAATSAAATDPADGPTPTPRRIDAADEP